MGGMCANLSANLSIKGLLESVAWQRDAAPILCAAPVTNNRHVVEVQHRPAMHAHPLGGVMILANTLAQ